jgi:catalase
MVTPEEAIAAVHDTFGAHAGYRALHAKGFLYQGQFTATPEAAGLSRAAHLDGHSVPALIRFSNGSGEPEAADSRPTVRGMAVKLTLPDGSTTDISSQTARLFVANSPDGFVDFVRAAKPSPAAGYRFARFAARNPEVFRGLRQNAVAAKIPAGYSTVEYHALHAFKFLDAAGGSRFVRYHWIPADGEEFVSLLSARSKSRDFLTEEFESRLARGPVRFTLQAQIAGPDDSSVDPSAPWASDERVDLGTLDITGIETERERDGEIIVFDPMNLTDGIEPSDDPVLHFRSKAYSVSVGLRIKGE